MKRISKLQNEIDKLSKILFGKDQTKCMIGKICSICHKPIVGFRDNLSKKEYEISGMCQQCQDMVFKEEGV